MKNKRYLIGSISVAGFDTLSFEDAKGVAQSEVMVFLDKTASNVVEMHVLIDTLMRNENKIIAVDVGCNKSIVTAIFAFLISNRIYSVYSANKDVIDADYVTSAFERKSDMGEIDNYFTEKYCDYNKVVQAMLDIKEKVASQDFDSVQSKIGEYTEIMQDAIEAFEYSKFLTDKLTVEYDSAIKKSNEAMELEQKLEEAEEKRRIANEENSSLRQTVKAKDQNIQELVDRVGNKGPGLSMYKTIMTSAVICKVARIMYVKEISYATYANSLITHIFEGLKVKGSRVKMLIYDNKNDFSAIYKPLRLIGTTEYLADKENLVKRLDKFVITEPNPNIVTDILKTDIDLLIVYDRLKYKNDVITGNNVHKFWVLNSKTDFTRLNENGFEVPARMCITRPDVLEDSIGIPTIEGYSGSTPSGKMSKYSAVKNYNAVNKNELIIRYMLENCGINILSRR